MSDRIYVWAANHAKETGACQEYRIKVPLVFLQRLGYIWGYDADGADYERDLQAMYSSDVDLFYATGGKSNLATLETIKAMKPAPDGSGTLRYPPIAVYDLDDNSDFVHPMNFTYARLGVRDYPSGKFLKPDSIIEFEWEDGRREILWDDKVTVVDGALFDIERNLENLKIRHQFIRQTDGATLSTPALANYFRDIIGQKNVYVFPNTVNLGTYEHFDVLRQNPNEVRVLWQGSQSHYLDWYGIREGIEEATKRYPEIKWVIYGSKFDWIYKSIPEDRIEFIPWGPYQQYKLRRGLLNIDINICPLANNPFNRCKSAIKWYEASLWKQPEATLAANVEPYHEIENGKTGFLYNSNVDFIEKLGILIKNVELRKTIAENAKEWVLANRTPEKTIPGLYEFYTELKEQQKHKHSQRKLISVS